MTLTLALIAHDRKKPELGDWVSKHQLLISRCHLVCTENTGKLVRSANSAAEITFVKSGPVGGDQQIGALIATQGVDALVFFPDPLSPMPHDVDVKALLRLAIVYDIPCALNVASAILLLPQLMAAQCGRDTPS
jgi:methylglyoxal synthase